MAAQRDDTSVLVVEHEADAPAGLLVLGIRLGRQVATLALGGDVGRPAGRTAAVLRAERT